VGGARGRELPCAGHGTGLRGQAGGRRVLWGREPWPCSWPVPPRRRPRRRSTRPRRCAHLGSRGGAIRCSTVAVVGCSGWCCSALARGGARISEAAAAAGLVHLPQLRQRRARISEAAVAASKEGRAASLRMQTSKQGSRSCSGQRHHASGSKKKRKHKQTRDWE
jgi:hypothetical protein